MTMMTSMALLMAVNLSLLVLLLFLQNDTIMAYSRPGSHRALRESYRQFSSSSSSHAIPIYNSDNPYFPCTQDDLASDVMILISSPVDLTAYFSPTSSYMLYLCLSRLPSVFSWGSSLVSVASGWIFALNSFTHHIKPYIGCFCSLES